ncbi:Zn(II)2Cys6 transcription factor [Aspergillus foveolatus]|uniref:Zn(II)2Cys6 transcription factor n=1 Tax=Aspergillus foveolatus TaxID=210207 RepID=UPI003CCDCD8B
MASQDLAAHQDAGSNVSVVRSRGASACEKCRLRKTKCDNRRPSCGFCLKRRVPCVYQDDNNAGLITGADILQAVNRVANLVEAQQRDQRRQLLLLQQGMPCASWPGHPWPRETVRPQGVESVLGWQILALNLPPSRCLFAQPVAEADQPSSLPDMSYSQLSRLESKYIEVLHTKNPILDLNELHRMVLHVAENGPDWSTRTCLVALVCAIAVLSEAYPGTITRSAAQPTPSLDPDDESGADVKLSLQFWNIALKRLGYAMRDNSVEAVQTLVLAGIWYMHRMEPLEAWKHFNLAGAAWNTLRLTRFPVVDLIDNTDTTPNELTILQALYFTIWKSDCELRLELPVPGPPLINSTDFPLAFPQPPRLGSQPSTSDASESERSWYYYLTEIAARHLLNRLVQMNSECADTPTERQVTRLVSHAEMMQAQISDWYTSLPSIFHFAIPDGYDADFQSDPMIFVLRHRYFTLRELVARPFVRLLVDGLLDGMDPLIRVRARSFASECMQFCMLKLSQTVAYRHQGNWYLLRSMTTSSLILAAVHLAQCRLREGEAAGATPPSENLMPPEAWTSRVRDAVESAQPFFEETSGGASNMKQMILAALGAAQQRSAWCGWRSYGKEVT